MLSDANPRGLDHRIQSQLLNMLTDDWSLLLECESHQCVDWLCSQEASSWAESVMLTSVTEASLTRKFVSLSD